eukprot:TRINITY_DN49281_c0_g1_i1.p1 TRINITY_DN49281_c0_g1~~TRINITY_DN49281_c0_g1_i1.p1  ORF type:complete len:1001 (-),score=205.76 TRINITY_DN49281_c0_g1_i1:125-3127(-)
MRNITLELLEARALCDAQEEHVSCALEVLLARRAEHAACTLRELRQEEMLDAAKVVLRTQQEVLQSAAESLQERYDLVSRLAAPGVRKSAELQECIRSRAGTLRRSGRHAWSRRINLLRDELESIDVEVSMVERSILPSAEKLVDDASSEVQAAETFHQVAAASYSTATGRRQSKDAEVQVAVDMHALATAELQRLQRDCDRLQVEDAQGRETAEKPQLWRRATLPDRMRCGEDGAQSRRIAQLAAGIAVDWCVAARATVGASRCWDVAEFMKTQEAAVLTDLDADGRDGLFLLEMDILDNNVVPSQKRRVLLDTKLLAKLASPKLKSPPMRLNFFELIRTSLGDPMFRDVWLRPEAPHFHEIALGLDRMKDIPPPDSLKPHLRPYQVAGFQWLAALARNGLGAILADDMGLGKTLQSITLLVHLHESGLLTNIEGRPRPALVVVPPGLLRNWQLELAKWAPQLRIYLYHGMPRQLPPNREDVDIFLTTFHTVRNDVSKLCDCEQISFSCMVIDEAQCIKNHNAKMTKAIKEVGTTIGHTRIALSGTPIENRVDELHSIFDFANYGYLGDQKSFSEKFSKHIEQARNTQKRTDTLELLRRLTHPFQMRRLKTDPSILPDLPEKIDLQSTMPLSALQSQLYSEIQNEFRSRMEASRIGSSNHRFERRGHIFAMLEKVRRVCSHPLCLDRSQWPEACRGLDVPEAPSASGKASRLFELLEEILPTHQKVIVFVTRKAVLSMLHKLIVGRFSQTQVLKFSGDLDLKERVAVENQFASDQKAQILLITVQCGGIGLNLVAASHVVHFDRCYNPAKEAQATDRCHRLGQKRAVCVHRFVTEGTYEERLEEIMQRKQDLSSLTVTRADDWIADYDDEALFDLFMLRSSGGSRRRPPPGRAGAQARPVATPSRTMTSASSVAGSTGLDSLPGEPSASSAAAKRARRDVGLASSSVAGAQHAECAICMDAQVSVQLLPCNHEVLCGPCAASVATCPICRCKITKRTSI